MTRTLYNLGNFFEEKKLQDYKYKIRYKSEHFLRMRREIITNCIFFKKLINITNITKPEASKGQSPEEPSVSFTRGWQL